MPRAINLFSHCRPIPHASPTAICPSHCSRLEAILKTGIFKIFFHKWFAAFANVLVRPIPIEVDIPVCFKIFFCNS